VQLEQLDHVAIAVADVHRSIEWYGDVLGFEKRCAEWGTEPAMMCAGTTCVALFEVEAEAPQPPPGRDTIAMRHLAFRSDRAGFIRAQDELREQGIDFTFMDHEIAHSIYFADPDGNRLEITTYDLK
jgi:catechol 2,3-dioxygenase-like lactoylglutathione lyase family enzyme